MAVSRLMSGKRDQNAPKNGLGGGSLSGWTPNQVKDALAERGTNLSELARRFDFAESYLRNALYRPLHTGEQIIAKFLGVEAKEIWPDRYDDNGKPDCREWSRKRREKVLAMRPHRSAA